MGCRCGKARKTLESTETAQDRPRTTETEREVVPTTQCLKCAWKHACEAWECFHEFGYEMANRRHVIGALRAVVLHTYKSWPELAKQARECALLVEEARDSEAEPALESLCEAVEEAYLAEYPEVRARLDELTKRGKVEDLSDTPTEDNA